MSLTRRRLFTRLAGAHEATSSAWISARGREARQVGYAPATAAAGSPIVRISSNENPVGPGTQVLAAITGAFPDGNRYPFNAHRPEGELFKAISAKFGARPENVTIGAGSGELLNNAVMAFTSPSRALVTGFPSFENPRETAEKMGSAVTKVPLDAELRLDVAKIVAASKGAGLVFFCNPNNPTATVHGKASVADMVRQVRAASPDAVILIDEAYHDYVTDASYESAIPLALATPNVFVTRTFSKAYGMAGLRAGYAVGHPKVIAALERFRMPNGTGTLVVGGALVALSDQAHIDAERRRNTEAKAYTVKALADMGYTGTDSQSNFIFVDLKRPARAFRDACAAEGVLVGRDFPPFEKTYCRISIGTLDEMKRAVDVFRKVLGQPSTMAAKGGR